MEAEAVRQREKAENRIKSRCKDPVAVSMYMELYDDRVRAEYRNSELKREQGRLASHYREAEQKAAEYDRIVSYADRRGKEIERLRLANAKLMEETGRLKDDACGAVFRTSQEPDDGDPEWYLQCAAD